MQSIDTGGLTFAFGDQYQRMAAIQAHSFAYHGLGHATVVSATAPLVDELKSAPTQIKRLAAHHKVGKPFEFERWALELSPFQTTIKTDADLFLPSGWAGLPEWATDLDLGVINGQPCSLQGQAIKANPYRKRWTALGLPEIHSAFFVFRPSHPDALRFFELLGQLFDQYFLSQLHEVESRPSTDFVYSVAWALMFGQDPGPSLPFIHMKRGTSGLNLWRDDWSAHTSFIQDQEGSYINGLQVIHPVHYYDKQFVDLYNQSKA